MYIVGVKAPAASGGMRLQIVNEVIVQPERCAERNEWFAIRCAASPLRVERGCAAREHEEVTTRAGANCVASVANQ